MSRAKRPVEMTDTTPPLVSVIVPMFNAADTLERAIDSALAQEFAGGIEIIAVDDLSRDDTCARVEALYGADPRVRLLRQERNQGPSAARNAAMAAARGTWIALLDADDLWLPGRLAALLAHAEEGDLIADDLLAYDAVAGCATGRYFKGAIPQGPVPLEGVMEPRPAFDLGFLKPLMRRALLETHGLRYREDLRHGEDLLLYGEVLCHGGRLVCVAQAGYLYTTPVGRASGQASPHQRTRYQTNALSPALLALSRAHAATLTHAQQGAIARRAAYFDYIDDYIACIIALRHRKPWAALAAIARRPAMLAWAWRVVRFRLSSTGRA